MSVKEQLIQGLSDAGCSAEAAQKIGALFETGSYDEAQGRPHGFSDPESGKTDKLNESEYINWRIIRK